MEKSWQDWAREKGYQMACGGPGVLDEVRAELERRKTGGEIEETFYQENLDGFTYLDGVDLPVIKTIIVLAMPRPAHKLTFAAKNGLFTAVLPPTYTWYTDMGKRIKEEFTAYLSNGGYQLIPLRAPLKLLATRLGLVKYGRNNIAYAPGMGSYHQLFAFASDAGLDPKIDLKNTPSVLAECEHCEACLQACPTGAIKGERFLLHAERCLTWHNERTGPWPDWLHDSAHHCLVGCMFCQEACPQNAGLLKYEELEVSFDEAETAAILEGRAGETDTVKGKLAKLGISGYEPVIRRNLKALLDKGRG